MSTSMDFEIDLVFKNSLDPKKGFKDRAKSLRIFKQFFRGPSYKKFLSRNHRNIERSLFTFINFGNEELEELSAECLGTLTTILTRKDLGSFFFRFFSKLESPNTSKKEIFYLLRVLENSLKESPKTKHNALHCYIDNICPRFVNFFVSLSELELINAAASILKTLSFNHPEVFKNSSERIMLKMMEICCSNTVEEKYYQSVVETLNLKNLFENNLNSATRTICDLLNKVEEKMIKKDLVSLSRNKIFRFISKIFETINDFDSIPETNLIKRILDFLEFLIGFDGVDINLIILGNTLTDCVTITYGAAIKPYLLQILSIQEKIISLFGNKSGSNGTTNFLMTYCKICLVSNNNSKDIFNTNKPIGEHYSIKNLPKFPLYSLRKHYCPRVIFATKNALAAWMTLWDDSFPFIAFFFAEFLRENSHPESHYNESCCFNLELIISFSEILRNGKEREHLLLFFIFSLLFLPQFTIQNLENSENSEIIKIKKEFCEVEIELLFKEEEKPILKSIFKHLEKLLSVDFKTELIKTTTKVRVFNRLCSIVENAVNKMSKSKEWVHKRYENCVIHALNLLHKENVDDLFERNAIKNLQKIVLEKGDNIISKLKKRKVDRKIVELCRFGGDYKNETPKIESKVCEFLLNILKNGPKRGSKEVFDYFFQISVTLIRERRLSKQSSLDLLKTLTLTKQSIWDFSSKLLKRPKDTNTTFCLERIERIKIQTQYNQYNKTCFESFFKSLFNYLKTFNFALFFSEDNGRKVQEMFRKYLLFGSFQDGGSQNRVNFIENSVRREVLKVSERDVIFCFSVLVREMCKFLAKKRLNSFLGKPEHTLNSIKKIILDCERDKIKIYFLFLLVDSLEREVDLLSNKHNLVSENEKNIFSFYTANSSVCSVFFSRCHFCLFKLTSKNKLNLETFVLGEKCLQSLLLESKLKETPANQDENEKKQIDKVKTKARKILFLTCEALICLKKHGNVKGLNEWFVENFGGENLWAEGMYYEECGKYLKAERVYRSFLLECSGSGNEKRELCEFYRKKIVQRLLNIITIFSPNLEKQISGSFTEKQLRHYKFIINLKNEVNIESNKIKNFKPHHSYGLFENVLSSDPEDFSKLMEFYTEKLMEELYIFPGTSLEIGDKAIETLTQICVLKMKSDLERNKIRNNLTEFDKIDLGFYTPTFFNIAIYLCLLALNKTFHDSQKTIKENKNEEEIQKTIKRISEKYKRMCEVGFINKYEKIEEIPSESSFKYSDFLSEVSKKLLSDTEITKMVRAFVYNKEIDIKQVNNLKKSPVEHSVVNCSVTKITERIALKTPISLLKCPLNQVENETEKVIEEKMAEFELWFDCLNRKEKLLEIIKMKNVFVRERAREKLNFILALLGENQKIKLNQTDILKAALLCIKIIVEFSHCADKETLKLAQKTKRENWVYLLPTIIANCNSAKGIKGTNLKVLETMAEKVLKTKFRPTIDLSSASFSFKQVKKEIKNGEETNLDRFVKELKRVAITIDESCLAVIQSLRKGWPRIEKKLRENFKVVEKEKLLESRKTVSMCLSAAEKSIIELNRLADEKGETPFEENFFKKNRNRFKKVISLLRKIAIVCSLEKETVRDNIIKTKKRIEKASTALKFYGEKLVEELDSTEKSVLSSSSKSLEEISPYLFSLKNFTIRIPGYSSEKDKTKLVERISSEIKVIRTKTLPKKLFFLEKSGAKTPFLLKAKEDLTLDERIMQFMRVFNIIGLESPGLRLSALTYPIAALPKDFGLICWVKNARPLIYFVSPGIWGENKDKNQKTNQNKARNRKTGNTLFPLANLSCAARERNYKEINTEAYNKAMREELMRIGLDPETKRESIPLKTKIDLFRKMKEKVDPNCFLRALWMSSSDSKSFVEKRETFTKSVAVMSIIGYVIGLGDRHLGNILLDTNTGRAAHIDYSLCFDRGKTLSVPETVPFRLTQTMRTTIGAVNKKLFEDCCVQTYRTLVENKESFILTLSPFLSDPIERWRQRAKREKKHFAKQFCRSFKKLRDFLSEKGGFLSSTLGGNGGLYCGPLELCKGLSLSESCFECVSENYERFDGMKNATEETKKIFKMLVSVTKAINETKSNKEFNKTPPFSSLIWYKNLILSEALKDCFNPHNKTCDKKDFKGDLKKAIEESKRKTILFFTGKCKNENGINKDTKYKKDIKNESKGKNEKDTKSECCFLLRNGKITENEIKYFKNLLLKKIILPSNDHKINHMNIIDRLKLVGNEKDIKVVSNTLQSIVTKKNLFFFINNIFEVNNNQKNQNNQNNQNIGNDTENGLWITFFKEVEKRLEKAIRNTSALFEKTFLNWLGKEEILSTEFLKSSLSAFKFVLSNLLSNVVTIDSNDDFKNKNLDNPGNNDLKTNDNGGNNVFERGSFKFIPGFGLSALWNDYRKNLSLVSEKEEETGMKGVILEFWREVEKNFARVEEAVTKSVAKEANLDFELSFVALFFRLQIFVTFSSAIVEMIEYVKEPKTRHFCFLIEYLYNKTHRQNLFLLFCEYFSSIYQIMVNGDLNSISSNNGTVPAEFSVKSVKSDKSVKNEEMVESLTKLISAEKQRMSVEIRNDIDFFLMGRNLGNFGNFGMASADEEEKLFLEVEQLFELEPGDEDFKTIEKFDLNDSKEETKSKSNIIKNGGVFLTTLKTALEKILETLKTQDFLSVMADLDPVLKGFPSNKNKIPAMIEEGEKFLKEVVGLKRVCPRLKKSVKAVLELENGGVLSFSSLSGFGIKNAVQFEFVEKVYRIILEYFYYSALFMGHLNKLKKYGEVLSPMVYSIDLKNGLNGANEDLMRILFDIKLNEKINSLFITEEKGGEKSEGRVERNDYALMALKRVEEKLSVDESKVRGVVKNLIKRAADEKNLCKMYEGWAPWI